MPINLPRPRRALGLALAAGAAAVALALPATAQTAQAAPAADPAKCAEALFQPPAIDIPPAMPKISDLKIPDECKDLVSGGS